MLYMAFRANCKLFLLFSLVLSCRYLYNSFTVYVDMTGVFRENLGVCLVP